MKDPNGSKGAITNNRIKKTGVLNFHKYKAGGLRRSPQSSTCKADIKDRKGSLMLYFLALLLKL